ncbi:MAG: Gmad2 immunoglobulin-like domain-containing protein [Candidatus Latescibacteria bacterium]|jgi:hypothetical protein|nr:Gmad2 immunoglobulin-like domain-containing protein [Candidatus Latescibacterota bacterium]
MKRVCLSLLVAAIAGLGCEGPTPDTEGVDRRSASRPATTPLEATYLIEGHAVSLVGGHAESPAAPGSATRIQTDVFGEPAHGDLDGDGDGDAVLLLIHDPGGSGTFAYLAAAIKSDGGYVGTNAVLLGDRILPHRITVLSGLAIADYLGRQPDESMSADPTVGRTKILVVDGGRLSAVDPSGESGPHIVVESPSPGSVIASPLRVSGRARGTWFFEGDFPLLLLDAQGNVLARSYATARGAWMTRDFVPFEGTLEFRSPEAGINGILRLIKDNPSNRRELDNAIEIPIRFR